MVKRNLPPSQVQLTRAVRLIAKITGMKERQPTEMGQRILTLMSANGIKNRAQFAEALGISRQRFHGWLYNKMDRDAIPATPVLRCADLLGTNPEYILGIHDDLRVETSLTSQEAVLLQAFRDLGVVDQERLLAIAADWVSASSEVATSSAPFRNVPPRTK